MNIRTEKAYDREYTLYNRTALAQRSITSNLIYPQTVSKRYHEAPEPFS